MNNETIDIIIADKAKAEIQEFIVDLQNAHKTFLGMADDITKFSKEGFKVKFPQELNSQLEKNAQLSKQINKTKQDTLTIEKKVIASKKRVAKQTSEEIVNTRILRRNADLHAIANSKLSTAYEKLSAKLLIMKRRYKDLATQQALGNELNRSQRRELKSLEVQIRKTDGALKRVDKSVGESFRNVGNYRSAWSGLTKVVTASIAAFGLYSGIQIARDILNDIKAIDAMNKALLQVTETTEAFADAKLFIVDVAEEAGVEIIGLTNAYTKFIASAKTTNLTVAETKDIFRQVAKAGAALGLSTDDINGSFRALEQIMNKGTVSSEELKQQLGERLPGAFAIFAKSMGLTTEELNKQLQLGNVLAQDTLPAFARELEKVYSLDKIDKVETLVAAQNRLSNAWTQFVESVDSGNGVVSKAFLSMLNAATFLIEAFQFLNMSYDEWSDKIKDDTVSDGYKQAAKTIRDEADKTNKTLQEVAQDYLDANKPYLDSLIKEGDLLKEQRDNIVRNKIARDELNEKIRANAISQGIYLGIVNAATDALKTNNNEKENENSWLIKTILSKTDEYSLDQLQLKTKQELLDILGSLNKKRKETQKIIKGSITFYEQLISKLEREAKATARNSKEWNEYLEKIYAAKDALRELKKEFDPDFQDEISFGVERVLSGDLDSVPFIDLDETEEQIQSEFKQDQARYKKLLDNQKKYNKEKERLTDQLQRVKEDFYFSITQSAATTLDAVFQSEIDDLDEKIEANNNYYDRILENQQLSDEQRSALESERIAKERQLQTEREEIEKRAFLFQQGSLIANIIIDTIQKVAAIKAQAAVLLANPVTATLAPIALAQIPFVIGAGAVATGGIAAESIAAFKDGHESGTYEGLAKINDQKGSLYQEIVTRKDGTQELYEGRDQIIQMNKGDKVTKASTSQDIITASIIASLNAQGNHTNNAAKDSFDTALLSKINKEIKKGFRGVKLDGGGKAFAKEMSRQNRINKA